MKIYVRAPFSEAGLDQLRKMFDEVIYEPWTVTGERYYEDEMLANLQRVQPDALVAQPDLRRQPLGLDPQWEAGLQ